MSFRFAFRGIWYCLKNERNFRIHLAAACYVLFFSRFYGFSHSETVVLLLTVSLVIAAEMINTAIERLVDMLSPSYNPLARLAKDIAAGAVLIFALIAVVIGAVMFWNIPVFGEIFQYFSASALRPALLLLTAVLSALFIFCGPSPVIRFVQKLFARRHGCDPKQTNTITEETDYDR